MIGMCEPLRAAHLITFYTESWADVAALVLAQRDDYCRRHGYLHVVHCGPYHDPSWYYAVQRLRLVRDLFQADVTDLVWVLNVAAVILDLNRPFVEFTEGRSGDVLICRDEVSNVLNAGSMILRRSPRSIAWLDAVIALALQLVDDPSRWHENLAIIRLRDIPEWAPLYEELPHPSINSYDLRLYSATGESQAGAGHFVVTFPGLPKGVRVKEMQRWLR